MIPEGYISLDVVGFPAFAINADGKVWSCHYNKHRIPIVDRDGYLKVKLNKNRTGKMFFIHRLVALVFLDNPKNLPEVNHKDKDRSNPSVHNLEWVTHQDNIIHSKRN